MTESFEKFFKLGQERKKLRNEVLDETGVSANEIAKRGVVSDADFVMKIQEGNAADVADKAVISKEKEDDTLEKVEKIKTINEDVKDFHWLKTKKEENKKAKQNKTRQKPISKARALYASVREGNTDKQGIQARETEREQKQESQREKTFRELAALKKFLLLQKRGEYLLLKHKDDPHLSKTLDSRLRQSGELESEVQKRLAVIKLNPETRFLAREYELSEYRRQMKDRFVIAPSREEYLGEVEGFIRDGRPVLLQGHTGSGKSELARIAAKDLTGHDPEVVYCNPQTRQSDIFGKQSLKETARGATVTDVDYGPLVRAMQEGKICILDEYNELDPRFRQVLKWIYNAKSGDTVPVPNNGEVAIQEGFGIIATANLGSKYENKPKLEPQEIREFLSSKIEIDYAPADELYDTALAVLSDAKGNIMLTENELQTTLKQFIDSVSDIQSAYKDSLPKHYGKDEDFAAWKQRSEKRPVMREYVLSAGTVAGILKGFETERIKNGTPLREYVNRSLEVTLRGKDIDDNDKKLARFIFAKNGFLTEDDITKRLGMDYSDGKFNLDAFNDPEEKIDPEKIRAKVSAEDIAKLDLYGKYGEDAEQDFGLPGVGRGSKSAENHPDIETLKKSNQPFLFETFRGWYNEDDAKKAKQEARLEKPEDIDYEALSQDINIKKFGEYTLNPDTQNIDFEKARVFIPDLSQFVGRKRYEVMKYVVETYGTTHHIPGIEYWKWIIENKDKAPQEFKDGNWYYLPGSLLRGRGGRWHVPNAGWDGGRFGRDADWLDDDWGADARVVLLEK